MARFLIPPISEEVDDIADEGFLSGFNVFAFACARPRRKGGALYVTPNSGVTQNGQEATSETNRDAASSGGLLLAGLLVLGRVRVGAFDLNKAL